MGSFVRAVLSPWRLFTLLKPLWVQRKTISGLTADIVVETLQQSIGHQSFRDMDYDQLHGSGTNVLDYTIWRLGCDVSVTKSSDPERDVGPYDWTGCELTSPVMKSDDYIEQFQEVCEVLKTLRVHINGSAGVHVHVGLGNEPFR